MIENFFSKFVCQVNIYYKFYIFFFFLIINFLKTIENNLIKLNNMLEQIFKQPD